MFLLCNCLACALHLFFTWNMQSRSISKDAPTIVNTWNQGRIRGGNWGNRPPLKPKKVTLFTMILCISESNICDIRQFCRPLFCHSSFIKYTSSLLQYRSCWDWTTKYYWNRPPLDSLAGSASVWNKFQDKVCN